MIGGLLCVVPGYLLTLVMTFYVLEMVVVVMNGEPGAPTITTSSNS